MSLTSALNSAVSGLKAQSSALSAISENIANTSTTAYKTTNTVFQDIVTSSGVADHNYSTGGVTAFEDQNVTEQGEINSTGVDTNIALNGSGFFVVSSALNNKPAAYTYSRNGNFSTDNNGNLKNDEGYYLLGQKTDASGNVIAVNANDLNSVQPVNVNAVQGAAKATSDVSFKLNLPSDAPIYDSTNPAAGGKYTSSYEVVDSLGVSNTVELTWTKTAANSWSAAMTDPVNTSNLTSASAFSSLTPSATMDPSTNTFDVTFNGDGSLNSTTPSPLSVNVTGYTDGANDQTFSLDVGTPNYTDGLTQYASDGTTPALAITSIEQDGVRYGKLSNIAIEDGGNVVASFDNGLKQTIFKIPVATFTNANGLTHINGSIYDENQQAGNLTLSLSGEGSAGTIKSDSLEASTVDTSAEFSKMIVAQQAYSAASQVVNTTNSMFQSLIQAVH